MRQHQPAGPLFNPLSDAAQLRAAQLVEMAAQGRQYAGILDFERSQRDYSGVVEEIITTRPRIDVTALIRSAVRTPTGTNAPLPVPRLAPIGPLAPQPVDVQARRARLYTLQRSAAALAPSRRVALCHRLPSSGGQVDVRATPDGRAFLGGVRPAAPSGTAPSAPRRSRNAGARRCSSSETGRASRAASCSC